MSYTDHNKLPHISLADLLNSPISMLIEISENGTPEYFDMLGRLIAVSRERGLIV